MTRTDLSAQGLGRLGRAAAALAASTPEQAGDATDESTLVQRAAGGDREAFEVLVRRYQRRVYAAAYGMVSDPEHALDVVQEAFSKAFLSLPRFDGRSSFYTWLYRITINAAIDFVRRERKERALSYDDGVRIDEDAALPSGAREALQSPETSARRTELKDALAKAIARLPDEQRAAILLREIDGLSYKEIASVLDCSTGTVMSRLHYARQKLKRMLGDL